MLVVVDFAGNIVMGQTVSEALFLAVGSVSDGSTCSEGVVAKSEPRLLWMLD